MKPKRMQWDLGVDRFGRIIEMTLEGNEIKIEIQPSSQRDEGERIWHLTKEAITNAAAILRDYK